MEGLSLFHSTKKKPSELELSVRNSKSELLVLTSNDSFLLVYWIGSYCNLSDSGSA